MIFQFQKGIFLYKSVLVLVFFTFLILNFCLAQTYPAGELQLEEYLRRMQLENKNTVNNSFFFRPLQIQDSVKLNAKKFKIDPTYIFQKNVYNTNRPYGWGDGLMIPQVGLQQYFSLGFEIKNSFLKIQFQPEFVWSQNKKFLGFPDNSPENIIKDRFFFWNFSDTPERFGQGPYKKAWWGQSSLLVYFGAFEIGISTRNIWWGPGQWNSLTFSRNAPGFPHFTLNTLKPAKTLIGEFEGQLIVGRLENSGLAPSQNQELNQAFFNPFNGDWRYLNGITLSYQPKWIPGLYFGFARTYQQYNRQKGDNFKDYFPIFEPFQKIKYGFDRDGLGRDQQATVSARYLNKPSKFEFYFEFGRRDHAFNWREAFLNPEHARAYMLGFNKLFDMNNTSKKLFFRGEITHQQESINRYIRYRDLTGGVSWHTHGSGARGFVNFGQPLGVGIGTGSNIQSFEFSIVKNYNKIGILLERLENHQDFYYRAFGQQDVQKPWVDLSMALLFDYEWNSFLINSKFQLINALNYQWKYSSNIEGFPSGYNLLSTHFQLNLIYRFND
ncbi:Capsule assembly protein Wzi [Aquiflexum balticum DSM 16537]|uniref:Capsule assembly protein Wzi n=1 Tax=Aquiflexum balticum DSM 16537 TaxID=758820 RepID=A0A1W2H6W9_9BACT|nr:capsule assembly Wzi family protein [Aquiflexum balticum]SMD44631.1 Capsule assembly protein Wzi [Aquiflexum balticum DSM 16537]